MQTNFPTQLWCAYNGHAEVARMLLEWPHHAPLQNVMAACALVCAAGLRIIDRPTAVVHAATSLRYRALVRAPLFTGPTISLVATQVIIVSRQQRAARIMGASFSKHKDLPPVEMLKNALLSLALATVYHSKGGVQERTGVDYSSYDGKKLPGMNGCDICNACFTFIESPQHAARGEWGSQFRVDKATAIHKYIKTNLSTEQEVHAFFKAFVEFLAVPGSREQAPVGGEEGEAGRGECSSAAL
jgi:hypothetical protein